MIPCNFELATTGVSSRISLDASNGNTYINNCGFKFGAAAQGIVLTEITRVKGGSLLAGGTSPTTLLLLNNRCNFVVDGFDLSNASAGVHLISSTVIQARGVFRDCKLPAAWSGSLNSLTPGAGSVYELFNCDGGDTNYRYRKATEFGTIQDETTIYRDSGSSDGTTNWSLKMVSGANAEYPVNTIDTPEFTFWNETVGSAITVTVEIAQDGTTTALNDDEIWLEVMYLGTSGFPLGSFISDSPASVAATPAAQANSSEAWTGLSGTNKKQALSVTFTPREKGVVHGVVRLAKASTTVYVDFLPTVS